MRKMKIAKQIRIQKLQTKNRMVGQTFNIGGHTSESLKKREQDYIKEIYKMNSEEKWSLYLSYRSIEIMKLEQNIYCSNSFEHNVFMRNFGHLYK